MGRCPIHLVLQITIPGDGSVLYAQSAQHSVHSIIRKPTYGLNTLGHGPIGLGHHSEESAFAHLLEPQNRGPVLPVEVGPKQPPDTQRPRLEEHGFLCVGRALRRS
jgi:hypothetical protein